MFFLYNSRLFLSSIHEESKKNIGLFVVSKKKNVFKGAFHLLQFWNPHLQFVTIHSAPWIPLSSAGAGGRSVVSWFGVGALQLCPIGRRVFVTWDGNKKNVKSFFVVAYSIIYLYRESRRWLRRWSKHFEMFVFTIQKGLLCYLNVLSQPETNLLTFETKGCKMGWIDGRSPHLRRNVLTSCVEILAKNSQGPTTDRTHFSPPNKKSDLLLNKGVFQSWWFQPWKICCLIKLDHLSRCKIF